LKTRLETMGFGARTVWHKGLQSTDPDRKLYQCGSCRRMSDDPGYQRLAELDGYDTDCDVYRCPHCHMCTWRHDADCAHDGFARTAGQCACAESAEDWPGSDFCTCRCTKPVSVKMKNALLVFDKANSPGRKPLLGRFVYSLCA
jgi:hypothetical protein